MGRIDKEDGGRMIKIIGTELCIIACFKNEPSLHLTRYEFSTLLTLRT